MNSIHELAAKPTRSFTRLAIAIVVAALLVSATIFFVGTDKTTTVPNNIIGTTTVVSTITLTSTSTFTTTSTLTVTGGNSVTNPLDGYCYSPRNQSNPLTLSTSKSITKATGMLPWRDSLGCHLLPQEPIA